MEDDADRDHEEWADIRRMVTNIVGFHDLVENEQVQLTPVKRVQYEAHVYANGVALARLLLRKFG